MYRRKKWVLGRFLPIFGYAQIYWYAPGHIFSARNAPFRERSHSKGFNIHAHAVPVAFIAYGVPTRRGLGSTKELRLGGLTGWLTDNQLVG
ncbi:hypothetical protein ES703_53238 [subsurface metagenome]